MIVVTLVCALGGRGAPRFLCSFGVKGMPALTSHMEALKPDTLLITGRVTPQHPLGGSRPTHPLDPPL